MTKDQTTILTTDDAIASDPDAAREWLESEVDQVVYVGEVAIEPGGEVQDLVLIDDGTSRFWVTAGSIPAMQRAFQAVDIPEDGDRAEAWTAACSAARRIQEHDIPAGVVDDVRGELGLGDDQDVERD